MHFLQRWLKGETAVTEELARDEQLLHKELTAFFRSFRIKEEVLAHLVRGEPIHLHLHKLQHALDEEVRIVERTTKTEHEILADLKYMSREHYIKNLEEVCNELKHAKDRDAYARHILSELHDTLMSEARKVKRLMHGERDFGVREALIDHLTIERHLVEKLATIEDFQRLFGDLYIGARLRSSVGEARKRLKDRVRKRMEQIIAGPDGQIEPTEDHYISELTARVFNKLEGAISDAIKGGYLRDHPHVDMEFVNSRHFDRFVRQEIAMDKRLGKFVPSQNTVEAFTSVFRRMYGQPARVSA